MHLKSVTLKGFKSFAQPTTFAFEPGVTCIVGPNGSGKSNVVDALAWVMGEQGAKTLRGGKMDDVIFAGTATRGPLGRAEVTLTIDNQDGVLPIEYTEVTIGRTLFRNGTSEYAINGETCRLLDVQELLSDTGLGREMHVIVGQGRLDSVLQATSEDRRGFIEEAAGILKHRRRKERTLRKLDAMEANLTRLSDLAGELRRQLKPLGRQAELAREAAAIAAAVREARGRLYADEVRMLRAELAAHARDEGARHAERMGVQERAATLRAEAERLEAEARTPAVDDARRIVHGLEQAHDRLRALDALVAQRLALLSADDEQIAAVTVTPAAIAEARADQDELAARLRDAQDAAAAAGRAVAAARGDLDALDADLARQSALLSRHDMQLQALRGARDTADSRYAALEVDVKRRRAALAAARDRRAEAEEALEALAGGDADELDGDGLAAAWERAQRDAAAAEETLAALRDRLHAAERETDALGAQTAALTRALASRGGGAALDAGSVAGAEGLVGDAVTVHGGWEAAIAAALGDVGEALLVAGRDRALAALDLAGAASVGAVDVVVADAAATPAAVVAGLIRAVEVVDAPAGVQGLLAHCYLAEDLAAVRAAERALVAADPDGRAVVVTRRGEVLGRYVLRGGSGTSSSRIELVAERDAADARRVELEVVVDALRDAVADAASGHDRARARSRADLDALRAAEAAAASRADAVNRATVRHEAAVAEADRLEAALAVAAEDLAAAAGAAREAANAFETAAAAPRPFLDGAARDPLVAELDAAREAELRARLDIEGLRERLHAGESRARALEAQRAREQAAADEAARRAVLRRAQRRAAEAVADRLPPVLESAARSLGEARTALSAVEGARTVAGERLRVVRAEEAGVRDRLTGLTEAVHSLELRVHERRLHVAGVLERAAAELGVGEDVLLAEYDGGEGFDRVAEQARLAQAERALERLGRINPLALEEFAALEQRHAFLTDQLADLTRTRADLLTIVAELDERMQQIFLAAFDDTRRAFGEVFPILFPGGTGSIALTDPDQPLTSGVEVTARPAGKRIERLSLLSGGERSLAAVALLAAIFTARPSPFYILDEVEAALDDANLGRLLGAIERLRDSSQLIVITHQKRTMEVADALYGVSMRQDGVSAVVGQRLGDRAAS